MTQITINMQALQVMAWVYGGLGALCGLFSYKWQPLLYLGLVLCGAGLVCFLLGMYGILTKVKERGGWTK